MKSIRKLILLAATTVLAACGGGGGDDDSPTVQSTPEGYWTGTTSNGWNVDLAVLENGETWGIYSANGMIYGALNGNTTWNASALSGSGADFYFPTRSTTTGSYSGTYTTKSSLRVTTAGTGVTVNAKYSPLYDQPATLSALAGTYYGQGLTSTSVVTSQSITVSSTGAITGGIVGCSVSGTATPRPSGKGVFNVVVTVSGSTCAASSGTTMRGVALFEPTSRRLVTLGVNSARSDGFFFIGAR